MRQGGIPEQGFSVIHSRESRSSTSKPIYLAWDLRAMGRNLDDWGRDTECFSASRPFPCWVQKDEMQLPAEQDNLYFHRGI